MKTKQFRTTIITLSIIGLLIVGMAVSLQAKEREQYKTGLPELTDEELQWQNKHMLKVKKIKLNKHGLERVNKWREKKGKKKIRDDRSHKLKPGKDLEVVTGVSGSVDTDLFLPGADMPGSVDNSQLKFFPPIRSQGSLNSCGSFSGVYYAMTYMYAMAKDLDAKNGGDAMRLSPKWAYNMVNGGSNAGSWYYWAYEIGQKHGAASWEEFPYDSNYRAWNIDAVTWENSLYRRFDQYGYVANTHTDTGIEQVKQMLLNGYVLNIPTYINSWQWQTIGDDLSTEDDDGFKGKRIVTWVNGRLGYHAMTVVGYNDDIWVDINGNSIIDSGEKGAFRIANSWGTGWGEGGYAWMSYDALKSQSGVPNGPSVNRIYGWYPSRAHWVTAKADYQPRLLGKFTLSHLKRDHLRLTLGVSEIDQSGPSEVWVPEMIYNQGGSYGFSGNTTAVDGTFVFDFSDLVPQDGGLKTYYIGIQDDTSGDEAIVKSFSLIDVANGNYELECLDIPQTVDGTQIHVSLDYNYFDGNIAPTAIAEASSLTGQTSTTITFYGSSSYDNDGDIVSYDWNFGDNASESGVQVDHVYKIAGLYTATLTITDNEGAQNSTSLEIEIMPDPTEIGVFVSDMQARLLSGDAGKSLRVIVTVMDTNGEMVPDALVQGQWSGMVSGEVSGTTQENGTLTLTSDETTYPGALTFIVDNIIASGYIYDSNLNTISTISESWEEIINQYPVAQILANQVSGPAPLEVSLDGTNSYDPDGYIVAYEWYLKGELVSNDQIYDPYFDTAGTYEISLVVTDDQGASHTDWITITAEPDLETYVFVSKITMKVKSKRGSFRGKARVVIKDGNGNKITSAHVFGSWSGLVTKDQSRFTDEKGKARFSSRKTSDSGTFIFTVKDVIADGYIYNPDNNVETEDFIDTP